LGNFIVNVVGLFLAEIVPSWLSIIFLQLTRPNPVPICLVVINGSKISFTLLSEKPGPESSKTI
jgi:hypothetical protein